MLTTIAVTRAKPQSKAYKLADEKGLHLLVQPNGARYWRFKYRFGGKEKALALGVHPDVTLAEAREKRDDARKLLANGIDPNTERKRTKLEGKLAQANTFEAIARDWHAHQKGGWSADHAESVWKRIERDAIPDLGTRPIAELEAPEVLACVRKIERRGANEQARRLMQFIGSVFRFAVATGRAKRDPTADLRGALKKAPPVEHRAALKAEDLPDFFTKLAIYDGHPATPLAIRLLMLTAVRTSELIEAHWSEFDLDGARWCIPAERMKMKREHIVPLSRQAVDVLKALREISTGDLVFPQPRQPRLPMSNNTILYALYRMGYHSRATGHGMRTLFSTTLHEQGHSTDVIERQLAHIDTNKVRAAYNRAEWLPERTKMMQHWADCLSTIEAKAKSEAALIGQ